MADQIEEVVKRGRWFYDGTVPAEVRIIRRNFEYPLDPDEELPEGWTGDASPPFGPDGFYYSAVFEVSWQQGPYKSMTTRSGSDLYSSLDEVIRCVETTLNGKVIWDET